MNFFKTSIVLLFCIFASVLADEKQDSVDQLVDAVLGNVLKNEELNPLKFHQDYDEEVDERIGLIRVHGNIRLSKGDLYGLNTLNRTGHAKLDSKDGKMIVTISLKTIDEVILDTDVSIHLTGMQSLFSVPIVAHVHHITIDSILEIGQDVQMQYFDVKEISDIQIRWKDAAHIHIIENFADIITNAFVDIFNKNIRDVIDQVVKPIMKEELKHVHL